MLDLGGWLPLIGPDDACLVAIRFARRTLETDAETPYSCKEFHDSHDPLLAARVIQDTDHWD